MFDALIVGGGPCGVSTAIYLKRANVNVAIIEKSYIGGQIGKSSELANYAGYIENDTNSTNDTDNFEDLDDNDDLNDNKSSNE